MNIHFKVHFETYLKGEDEELDLSTFEKFNFDVDTLIIDVRDEIMWKIYRDEKEHDEYYLEIENITPKLYKDFGKLFFNKGLLPKTIDNFPLSKFVGEERTYEFVVYRKKKSEINDYNKNVVPSYMIPLTQKQILEKKYKKLREEEEKKIVVIDMSRSESEKKKLEEYHRKMDEMEKEMNMEEYYKKLYNIPSKKVEDEW